MMHSVTKYMNGKYLDTLMLVFCTHLLAKYPKLNILFLFSNFLYLCQKSITIVINSVYVYVTCKFCEFLCQVTLMLSWEYLPPVMRR